MKVADVMSNVKAADDSKRIRHRLNGRCGAKPKVPARRAIEGA
jgi:hypothetical protein